MIKISGRLHALAALMGLTDALYGSQPLPPPLGECSTHGDYLMSPDGVRFLPECPKCHSEKLMFGIPGVYRDARLTDFKIKLDGEEKALSSAVDFIDEVKTRKRAIRTMSGNYGAGKTFLASIIANEINGACIFATASQIIDAVRQAWKSGGKYPDYNNTPLLIIDEVKMLGHSDVGRDNRKILSDILNYRYLNILPFIVISNLTPSAKNSNGNGSIQEALGDDVFDRLRDGRVIMFPWPSRRGNK